VKKSLGRRGPDQSKVKLYICNNCGYNCEYPNNSPSHSESTIIYCHGNLTHEILVSEVGFSCEVESCKHGATLQLKHDGHIYLSVNVRFIYNYYMSYLSWYSNGLQDGRLGFDSR
jgi:hypothetical protein